MGLVRVTVGPPTEELRSVDAIVVEDDTFNVLSAGPEFRPPGVTLEQAGAVAAAADARPLGSVAVRQGRPLIFQAIVHDLSREPSCTEADVRASLAGVFAEAERRQLKAIAMLPLGVRLGPLDLAGFLDRLHASLAGAHLRSVERIWIVAAG
jgi:hypothetical protein